MKQKKLTDEEIAQALLQNIEYSKTLTYFDKWGNHKAIMITDIIDLIHRLLNEVSQWKSKAEHIEEVYNADREHFIKTTTEKKAEIERLTEEVESIANEAVETCENCYKSKQIDTLEGHIKELKENHEIHLAERQKIITALCDEKRELQNQVDELKAKQVIECHGMLKGCDIVNQTVKDTAKEIYDEINSCIKQGQDYCGLDWRGLLTAKTMILVWCKKHGVEVD